MNTRLHTIPILIVSSLLVFTTACTTTSSSGPENRERFPEYRVDEIQNTPKITKKDRRLARKIREHQTENVTPLQEIERQSKIIEYLLTLGKTEINSRVSSTGKTLASNLNGQSLSNRFFGRWYRVRGTPISKPMNDPFQGHLPADASVQQFTMKNPADYEEPSETMYYVIITLEHLPAENASDVILEMDGLLWTTWDVSSTTTSHGKTPQSEIPVLFVKNLRYVKQ